MNKITTYTHNKKQLCVQSVWEQIYLLGKLSFNKDYFIFVSFWPPDLLLYEYL